MAHFESSVVISAPRHQVFEFHRKVQSFIKLMPDGVKAEPTAPTTLFDKGVEFELRITSYGISIVWSGVIEEFEGDVYFVDRQTDGPFTLWLHTHRFEDHGEGTLLTDIVEYDVPFGLFGKLADDLYIRSQMARFFEIRHKKTKEIFEKITASSAGRS